MLINCVAEKTNAHSSFVISAAFSPDGTKIVSGSADKTIKVWDFGAREPSKRPALAKSDVCWLAWHSHNGAVEREEERPQRGHQFGRVFPGRDQDCVRIG